MKVKIISFIAAVGLITNVATASNSVRLGYASDYFYRGVQKAEESIQTSLRLGHSLGSVNGSVHVCSNQAVDSGSDSYHMGAGLGTSFADGLLSTYAGVNHFEDVPGSSLAEAELRVSFNTALNPSLAVFRDLDESLYTYELGVSHVLETKVADLDLSASYGNTETSATNDTDYYSVGVGVSKSLSDSASLGGSVNYIDADGIEDEFVFGVGLTFNF